MFINRIEIEKRSNGNISFSNIKFCPKQPNVYKSLLNVNKQFNHVLITSDNQQVVLSG